MGIFFGIMTIVLLLLCISAFDARCFLWALTLLAASILFGYLFFQEFTKPLTPEQAAEKQLSYEKRQIEMEEAKIPKILSQTQDGCTVYKFFDDYRNHYFTRCSKEVSTESPYRSGKNTNTESIQTHLK